MDELLGNFEFGGEDDEEKNDLTIRIETNILEAARSKSVMKLSANNKCSFKIILVDTDMAAEGYIDDGWQIATIDVVEKQKKFIEMPPMAILGFNGGKIEGPAFGHRITLANKKDPLEFLKSQLITDKMIIMKFN